MPVISIKNLSISANKFPIIKDLSLELGQEKFGLIGESGSGKSMLAKALLGIVPSTISVEAKQLQWGDHDLRSISIKEWQHIRGKEIALILQEAKASLNPLLKIGSQLEEIAGNIDAGSALEAMNLSKETLSMYPHQLSGGMGQRVMIAMMLIQKPKFLIADEIVSALDKPLQDEILQLLQSRIQHEHMGLLYISHDLQQACQFCDRIGVMKAGELIAIGTASQLKNMNHPYIQHLFNSIIPEPPE